MWSNRKFLSLVFPIFSLWAKELVIFDYSGHSPMDTEAAKLVDEVVEFVELYK